MKDELNKVSKNYGGKLYKNGGFQSAAKIFNTLIKEDDFVEFLTIPTYKALIKGGNN